MLRVDRSTVFAYLLAILVGAGLVARLFSWKALFPAHALDVALLGDGAVSAIGQRYFLNAPLAWPPLHVDGPGGGEGLHIGLTDSIPFAMLFLRPFRALLPPGFFLQALWTALAWLLQPASAVYALRGTGERRVGSALAVAILSVSLPSLLLRYGHMALCTHAVLLLAIGLYFRLCRSGRDWAAGITLCGVALLIHPYLAVMVAALLAAVPLTLILRRDGRWPVAAVLGTAACFAVVTGLANVLGYGDKHPAPGFGYYSMNLLSPVTPSFSQLFGDLAPDATGGQGFEGMQYLGAGILLLACVAFTAGRIPIRRHAGLLLIAVTLTVFALSNDVTLGPWHLLRWPIVAETMAQFRSTGRFFWPVAYILIVGSVAATAQLRPTFAAPLLALVCLLQLVDTVALRHRTATLAAGDVWVVDYSRLAPIFAAHDHMTLWPIFGCGATAESAVDMQISLLASRTLMGMNTMFAARTAADTACPSASSLAAPLQPGELRVIHHRLADAWWVPDADRYCRRETDLVLCSANPALLSTLDPLPTATLRPGESVNLPSTTAETLLRTGWSVPEPVGIWTEGSTAVLRFRQSPDSQPRQLRLEGIAIAPARDLVQHIVAEAGDTPPVQQDCADMAPLTMNVPLPAGQREIVVTLHIAQPTRPTARAMSSDGRALGFMLKRATLLDTD